VGGHETLFWLNFWEKYFSSSFHFLLSLYIGLGVLLLCILLELSLLIQSRVIYQVTFQSMHFQFCYIEKKKKLGIFHFLAFLSFEFFFH
jgi:hypothetical protein